MWSAFADRRPPGGQLRRARGHRRLMYCVAIAGGIAGFVRGGRRHRPEPRRGRWHDRHQPRAGQLRAAERARVLPGADDPGRRRAGRARPRDDAGVDGADGGRRGMGADAQPVAHEPDRHVPRPRHPAAVAGLPPLGRRRAGGAGAVRLFNLQALEQSQQISVVTQRLATLGRTTTVESDPRLEITKTTAEDHRREPAARRRRRELLGGGQAVRAARPGRHAVRPRPRRAVDDRRRARDPGPRRARVVRRRARRDGAPGDRGARDPVRGALLLALAATMVGVVPISLADYPPRTNAIAATFILEVGALAALLRHARRGATRPAPSAPR